jgi:hypothetical protein
MININNIFPWFRKINYAPFLDNIAFGPFINPYINKPMNKEIRKQYKKNNEEIIFIIEKIILESTPEQKKKY